MAIKCTHINLAVVQLLPLIRYFANFFTCTYILHHDRMTKFLSMVHPKSKVRHRSVESGRCPLPIK